MLQAVGGSMMNPVAVSIIANTFTDPASAPAPSASGAACSACPSRPARPSAALLVDSVGWRGIFWVNIPGRGGRDRAHRVFVPESAAPPGRARLDPVGQVLVIVTLASLTYAIIEGPRAGWTSPMIVILFAVAARRAASGWSPMSPRREGSRCSISGSSAAPRSPGATLIANQRPGRPCGASCFLNTL
jgi:hypothetical protein